MPIILLHSSKTMRSLDAPLGSHQKPLLLSKANTLAAYLKKQNIQSIQKVMGLSIAKANEVNALLQNYSPSKGGMPAIDIFLGDIYSGLQAPLLSKADRNYANEHLFILSGLYGVLRALDEIQPYRLEMGYKFSDLNLYDFWGDAIAKQLPENQPIINLSAKEYTKAVFPHFKNNDGLKNTLVISPKFLTVSPKTHYPTFVTVHAKIARGAFAHWLIRNRIEDAHDLQKFAELGYRYEPALSTPKEPVFVAKEFKGLGLSIRLT